MGITFTLKLFCHPGELCTPRKGGKHRLFPAGKEIREKVGNFAIPWMLPLKPQRGWHRGDGTEPACSVVCASLGCTPQTVQPLHSERTTSSGAVHHKIP